MSFLSSSARTRIPPPSEMWQLFGDALEHRSGLVRLELQEARGHAVISLSLAIGIGLLVMLTGFAFTLFVAALVWDSPHRAAWLAGLCGGYVLAGAMAAWALRRRLLTWKPLSETKAQLGEDQRCLSQLIKSALS